MNSIDTVVMKDSGTNVSKIPDNGSKGKDGKDISIFSMLSGLISASVKSGNAIDHSKSSSATGNVKNDKDSKDSTGSSQDISSSGKDDVKSHNAKNTKNDKAGDHSTSSNGEELTQSTLQEVNLSFPKNGIDTADAVNKDDGKIGSTPLSTESSSSIQNDSVQSQNSVKTKDTPIILSTQKDTSKAQAVSKPEDGSTQGNSTGSTSEIQKGTAQSLSTVIPVSTQSAQTSVAKNSTSPVQSDKVLSQKNTEVEGLPVNSKGQKDTSKAQTVSKPEDRSTQSNSTGSTSEIQKGTAQAQLLSTVAPTSVQKISTISTQESSTNIKMNTPISNNLQSPVADVSSGNNIQKGYDGKNGNSDLMQQNSTFQNVMVKIQSGTENTFKFDIGSIVQSTESSNSADKSQKKNMELKNYQELPQVAREMTQSQSQPELVQNQRLNDTNPSTLSSKITSALSNAEDQKVPVKIEIQLNPPSLGNVEISLTEDGGKTSLMLTSDNQKTQELLKTALPMIIDKMSVLNFNVVNVQINGQEWYQNNPNGDESRDNGKDKKEKDDKSNEKFEDIFKKEV